MRRLVKQFLNLLLWPKKKLFNFLHRHDGGTREVDRKENNVDIPNEILFPLLIEDIKQGKTCTLRLRGNSMRPFLESNRDLGIFIDIDDVKVGDPVLAEIEPGHYVMHRVMKIKDGNVTLMGDGNLGCEYCTTADIRASVIGFIRKGRHKVDRTDGVKWRTYSWFWVKMRPIRRWLLAFYRYIWLNIFKLKPYKPLKSKEIDEIVKEFGYKKSSSNKK